MNLAKFILTRGFNYTQFDDYWVKLTPPFGLAPSIWLEKIFGWKSCSEFYIFKFGLGLRIIGVQHDVDVSIEVLNTLAPRGYFFVYRLHF